MTDPNQLDPTARFSDRVQDYVRCRPTYPKDVLEFLRDELDLAPAAVVADIGSGTGILSRLFLDNGNLVYGVEPNPAMRQAAESLLRGYDRFCSVAGRAEGTDLPAHSIDFVVVGQAFHWFEVEAAQAEFRRILKHGAWAVLIWNSRRTDGTEFLQAYEQFLRRWCPGYEEVSSRYANVASLRSFFGAGGYGVRTFENWQEFDLAGLQGRLLSSSYAHAADHPQRGQLLAALRELFVTHQRGGVVRFEYDTPVYYGKLP